MTRLNLVSPTELSDQHLFAEFREIKMVPKSLRRSLYARGKEDVLRMVPNAYTLNKGHVSFFYDKGVYLKQRYDVLIAEMQRRGMRYNPFALLDPDGMYDEILNPHSLDARFQKNYTPTSEAIALVRARIIDRISIQPAWYRWTKSEKPAYLLHL